MIWILITVVTLVHASNENTHGLSDTAAHIEKVPNSLKSQPTHDEEGATGVGHNIHNKLDDLVNEFAIERRSVGFGAKSIFHQNYSSILVPRKYAGRQFWRDLSKSDDEVTSLEHYGKVTQDLRVRLKFSFPFYGQIFDGVIVNVKGYITLADKNFLYDTHDAKIIAPLSAGFFFNPRHSNYVKATQNEHSFTVQWGKMTLKDRTDLGNFTFQATLFRDGSIIFIYKELPAVKLSAVGSVTIGVRDISAGKCAESGSRMCNMHQIDFTEYKFKNWTTIVIRPEELICQENKNCDDCTKANLKYSDPQCFWCKNQIEQCFSLHETQEFAWKKGGCQRNHVVAPMTVAKSATFTQATPAPKVTSTTLQAGMIIPAPKVVSSRPASTKTKQQPKTTSSKPEVTSATHDQEFISKQPPREVDPKELPNGVHELKDNTNMWKLIGWVTALIILLFTLIHKKCRVLKFLWRAYRNSILTSPFPHNSEMLDYEDEYFLEEDKMGMTVSAASVTLSKDTNNLIGISIGGGAPLCPCLYVVQVFDNTPAAKEGSLQSGDELLAVEGQSVKGKTKGEAAKMIQAAEGKVTIHFNRLHADPKQGKGLDLALKKAKHRLVENMSTATADALGLSRAILCNDSLVKKLQELEATEGTYRGLVEHSQRVLRANFELLQVYKAFGDTFAAIGVREPQPRASEAFRTFGDQHRQIEKEGIKMLQTVKPILNDLGTYLYKAIPDTKLTIKKYADAKFEYLSYCLKVKEMDDEEHSYASLQEPLYRLETGNYEYRLVLRCRQEARTKFAKLRADVLVKLELLDNKHVQDVTHQLKRLLTSLAAFHKTSYDLLNEGQLFPVEVDLSRSAFSYPSQDEQQAEEDDDDTEILPENAESDNLDTGKTADDDNLIDVDLFSGMTLTEEKPPQEQPASDLDELFGAPDTSKSDLGDLLGL
ncbi:Hypothetical predicted protein [Cloeon dipterum]|uniref:PRKCA-binding protein n=1 Tax=Cloeon dipterum TaxID=197152 RepID=A0A8S1DT54_9INSE|nr:Hypothetical predicted protein [Cloeon dipterum]